jgi:23S rRNA pseudouridine2457 synthase
MNQQKHRYYIINKPYNMVSQFVSTHDVGLLGDLDYNFPEGTHAIGRLDNNSEGLLILTTNKKVTKLLFSSAIAHKRTYLVQVKKEVSTESLHTLKNGVSIFVKGGVDYITTPCDVTIVSKPVNLFELPEAKLIYGHHTWLLITLTEGKFHQVRKMVDAVGHRCTRLIRVSIEDLLLEDLQPGCVKELEEEDFFTKLKIDNWK